MAGAGIKLNRLRPAGLGGKIFATLFFGAFLAGGLFFGWLLLGELYKNIRTYFWQSTDCKIIESRVNENGNNDESPYMFVVTYEYTFNGTLHKSSQASITGKSFSDYSKAQALVDRFPEGSQSTCLVDPEFPSQAVLIKGQLWMAFFLVIPLVFVLVGGGGVIGAWTMKLMDKEEESKSKAVGRKVRSSLSEKAKSGMGRRIQFWLFLGFFLVGTVLAWVFFGNPMIKVLQAKSWVETPCMVESSKVRSHRGDEGTTYSVDILYRYTFEGKERKSNRYKFMGGSSSGRSGKTAIVRQYPRGKKAVCFVNPSNPSEAVLQPGFTWDMLFGLIPLVFAVVGFFGLVHYWRTAPARNRLTPKTVGDTGAHHAREMETATGPVELKSKASPMMKLFGIIFIAVFWNGIVSVFLWQVVKGWQSSRGGFMEKWFLPIFLIPFVLVGLFLIYGIFHQFLALFNPRPRLRLGSSKVALGEEIVVQWKVMGRVHKLDRFKLQLEGREETRYRRGTRTYTDKNVFCTLEIANLTSRMDMRTGQARLQIPPDSMHTFKGDNNKILWTIKVSGEIRRWPDIDDEFPVEILPQIPKS